MLSSGASGRKKVGNCIFHSHSATQVLPGMLTSEDWLGLVGQQCPPSLTNQQNHSWSASLSFSKNGFLNHYDTLTYFTKVILDIWKKFQLVFFRCQLFLYLTLSPILDLQGIYILCPFTVQPHCSTLDISISLYLPAIVSPANWTLAWPADWTWR